MGTINHYPTYNTLPHQYTHHHGKEIADALRKNRWILDETDDRLSDERLTAIYSITNSGQRDFFALYLSINKYTDEIRATITDSTRRIYKEPITGLYEIFAFIDRAAGFDPCQGNDWCPFCDNCGDDGSCWECGHGHIRNHDHYRWEDEQQKRTARYMESLAESGITPW